MDKDYCAVGSALNQQVRKAGTEPPRTDAESMQAFRKLKAHCNECRQCLTAYNIIHKG
jgi:hypothetical protein